ncbi:MAG TPA: hypothetical protein VMB34_27680 [Acetobacteraceae bacterium]|nr:hypothetical protein [Acetobacteraceae bacterium]
MHAIGRAISELIGVLTAGFIAFFLMLAYAAGLLLLLACGFVCAGFLLVALFSMVMWLFTHDAHALHLMLGYFGYAGGTFAVITTLSYYHGKVTDGMRIRRNQRIEHQRASYLGVTALH